MMRAYDLAMETIQQLEAADTPQLIADALDKGTRKLGFGSIIVIKFPAVYEEIDDCMFLNTRPAAFSDEYFGENMLEADPVFHHAFGCTGPYSWSDAHRLSPRERCGRVADLARLYGMTDGFVFAVQQSMGRGLVSLACGTDALIPDASRAAHLMGTYAIARAHELEHQRQAMIELHWRERECLEWIAVGKTDSEIASILGLSSNTVRMYVENAKVKLGAPNRTSAVVLALKRSALNI